MGGPPPDGDREGGSLTVRSASLVRVSVSVAAGETGGLRRALREAVEADVRPARIEEALLQTHLFLGFPAALEALREWRSVREGSGDAPAVARASDPPEARRKRGRRLCRRVYGENYEPLRRSVRRLHPDIDRWMIEEGYGKVLARPGLDLVSRELCVVAILTVERRERQLHSHLRGALNAGASPREVEEALALALEAVGDGEWTKRARTLWSAIRNSGMS